MPSHNSSQVGHASAEYEADAHPQTPLLSKSISKTAAIGEKTAVLLQDWWLWELASAVVASLATIAILLILLLYDGSSLPDWPSVFTVRISYHLQSHI